MDMQNYQKLSNIYLRSILQPMHYSIKQSALREAGGRPACQETTYTLWDQNVHYRVHRYRH